MDTISTKQQTLIDKYFEGILSIQEEQQFNQLLKDPKFQEAVLLQRELQNVLHTQIAKSPLKKVFKKIDQQHDTKVRPIRRLISIAAAVLILGIVGIGWWANKKFSQQAIAAEFQEALIDKTTMGENTPQEIIQKALTFYKEKDYDIVINLLNEIKLSDGKKIYFYAQEMLAYSYFNLEKYEKSIDLYTNIVSNSKAENHNFEALKWNRLLARMAANKSKSKTFELELNYFLEGNSSYYQTKAKKLKSRLDSPWRIIVFN